MNRTDLYQTASTIITRFDAGDTVMIGECRYQPIDQNHDGIWLRRLDEARTVEFFSYKELAQLRASGDWRFQPKPKDRALTVGASDLTLLPAPERARVLAL